MIMSRVKDIIDDMNMTQTEFASLLGITVQRLNGYLTGRTNSSNDMLVKFADALGITVDYLIGLTDNAMPYMSITEFSSLTYHEKPIIENKRIVIDIYESRSTNQENEKIAPYASSIVRKGSIYVDNNKKDLYSVENYFKDSDYAIFITEDSMSPHYLKNDLVYVSQTDIRENGKIYALKFNEEDKVGVCLRKCVFQNDFIIIVQINTDYLPIVLDLNSIGYDPIAGTPVHFIRECLLQR